MLGCSPHFGKHVAITGNGTLSCSFLGCQIALKLRDVCLKLNDSSAQRFLIFIAKILGDVSFMYGSSIFIPTWLNKRRTSRTWPSSRRIRPTSRCSLWNNKGKTTKCNVNMNTRHFYKMLGGWYVNEEGNNSNIKSANGALVHYSTEFDIKPIIECYRTT